MSFTYDPTQLETNEIYQVRLAIGDTDATDPQLQDEEIQMFLDVTGSVADAVRLSLMSLAAKYARYTDKWVGDLKILASQRFRAYQDLLGKLATESIIYRGIPYAGGIRVGDKEVTASDPGLVSPFFVRGIFDFDVDP